MSCATVWPREHDPDRLLGGKAPLPNLPGSPSPSYPEPPGGTHGSQ